MARRRSPISSNRSSKVRAPIGSASAGASVLWPAGSRVRPARPCRRLGRAGANYRTAASWEAEVGMVAEGHRAPAGRRTAGWPRLRGPAIDLDRRLQTMREGEGGQQLLARVLEPGLEPRDPAARPHGANVPWLPRRHRPVDRQPVGVGVEVEPVEVRACTVPSSVDASASLRRRGVRGGGRRRGARSPWRSAQGSPRRCSGRSWCRPRTGCRPRGTAVGVQHRGGRVGAEAAGAGLVGHPATGMSVLR